MATEARAPLRDVYGTCPATLKDLLRSGPADLAGWNIAAIGWLREVLGIETPTSLSSEMAKLEGSGTEKLVQICQRLGASRYLTTEGARGYLKEADFHAVGITVEWVDYAYPHRLVDPAGDSWMPSIVDLLLAEGTARARAEVFGAAPLATALE